MRSAPRTLMLCATLAWACKPVADHPDWLDAMIAELEREPVANPPALIASYEWAR